jgi:hypothetical protein
VHAVGEIDVSVARRAEHNPVAPSPATKRVRRGVDLSGVRFHFCQPDGDRTLRCLVLQHAAKQLRRNLV